VHAGRVGTNEGNPRLVITCSSCCHQRLALF
jgi:hypothetical protein